MYTYLRSIIDDYQLGDIGRLERMVTKALEYGDIKQQEHDELMKVLIYKHKTAMLSQ